MAKKITEQENVKPGVYLRTNEYWVGDFPDAIYRCKDFKYYGPYSERNVGIFEVLIDADSDKPYIWDFSKDFDGGWQWSEIMYSLDVYENGQQDVIGDIFKNPLVS